MASLLVGLLMVLAGVSAWGGLGWMIWNVPPTRPLAQVVCFVFAFVGVASLGALLAWLGLRPRLDQGRLRSPAGYVFHSMLLAVIVLFALWMQSLRILTPTVAVMLLGLYVLLELAVLFGTRGSVELPLRRS